MCLLSYNSNGLRNLSTEEAIRSVAAAGYDGIELSVHKSLFHPLNMSVRELKELKNAVESSNLRISCLAAGSADILSDIPYEPSLIAAKAEQRQMRINLIRRTMEVARYLEAPVVNFASGLLSPGVAAESAHAYLVEGIQACLRHQDDVILAIEPEPGMFIETTEEAIDLIQEINSPKFALNLDIGHVYCCEDDYLGKIAKALDYSVHIHVEDIVNKVHHHEIPGTGEIDFLAFAKLCRQKGYQDFISVELYHHASVWQQALQQSKDFLSNILHP